MTPLGSAVSFEFATATRILFGAGNSQRLPELAQEFGSRVLFVRGANPDRAANAMRSLNAAGVQTTEFAVPHEPTIELVQRGTVLARNKKCDMVIGFGGGSVIDAGKAIAALATNTGPVLDYLEVIGQGKGLAHHPLPYLAVPTTAGTGSEVTRNAVIASPEHQVKVSLRSPSMLPALAIVDPDLTVSLPPAIAAATGLDALTQLIEPFVCSRANPIVDALCLEGMRRAARSLRNFVSQSTPESRADMSLASMFGGLALANAGLGAAHGFAGPIGGMFPAPHGAICAALLPYVIEANFHALKTRAPHHPVLPKFTVVARCLLDHDTASAEDAVSWVRSLVADLNIPNLSVYGLREEHVPEVVSKAASASSMKANPIPLTHSELSDILLKAL